MAKKRKRPKGKVVRQYVIDTFGCLGLHGWTIHIVIDKRMAQVAAIKWDKNERWAKLRLGRAFFDTTPEDQAVTVVHEGLHLAMSRLVDVVESDLKRARVMKKGQFDLLLEVHRRQQELVVDQLSNTIAHRFPLPPWADD